MEINGVEVIAGKRLKQGVSEGWDPDTTRLEQDVRDALENGDDYTAKQYAKMAPTPEAKKYLLNIIKQAMYIDDLGGETDWKGVAEVSDATLTSYLTKVDADSQKHDRDPTKRSAAKRDKSVAGFSRAFNKLDARKEKVDEIDPNNYDSDWDYYAALKGKRPPEDDDIDPPEDHNDYDPDEESYYEKSLRARGLDEQSGLGLGENDEKEADYGKSYQDMVRRMGAKAREQERSRPVDIGALARKLRDIEHKDSK